MLRSALTVGLWTMASRVLGFARDVLIAAALGAGPVADAFFVALKLPNLFRRLFGEGAFNAAFVPSFSGLLAAEGRAEAKYFAEETLGVMVFWLAFLTLLGEIFMPQLISLIAPGFGEIPEKFAMAVTLSRITFPYLFLICLAALASSVLNGVEKFSAAAAAPVLFNLSLIAALLWLTPLLPNAGYALSVGVLASGVLQLGLLVLAMQRAGMGLRIPSPRLTPRIRALLRRIAPGLLGAGATQLNLVVDVIIASLMSPGTVSILYYADRVTQLPLGTIGVALGTALLPLLSRQLRAGEAGQANNTLNRALEYGFLLSLPAAVALIVCAWPVMFVLFGRGAFDAENVRLSAQALIAYSVGLPAYVAVKALAPGMFARGDTATPMKIGLATVGVNLVLNVVFMVPLRHMGPALATSLASVFNAVALWVVLYRRGHLTIDAVLHRRAPRIVLAAVAMAAALFLAQFWLFADPTEMRGLKWFFLALLIALGMATYAAAGQIFGGFDLRESMRMLARRRT
ncbi:MAG: murein biosynthesis integral membrane protein MurJ [Acetobacteraceae bacterium]|nr:murein biosynthesis integral membrane protein MurJ [Acetobacteraceae bacterium]MSP30402.1 murein biosynthesis integral membrane protein MurJ [Acetobacteraceae bacterium]